MWKMRFVEKLQKQSFGLNMVQQRQIPLLVRRLVRGTIFFSLSLLAHYNFYLNKIIIISDYQIGSGFRVYVSRAVMCS